MAKEQTGIGVFLNAEIGEKIDGLIEDKKPKYANRAHLISVAVDDLYQKEKGE